MQKDLFQVYKPLSGTYLKIFLFKTHPYLFSFTCKGHFSSALKKNTPQRSHAQEKHSILI